MSDLHIYYRPEPRFRLWCTIPAALFAAAGLAGVVYAIGWMP